MPRRWLMVTVGLSVGAAASIVGLWIATRDHAAGTREMHRGSQPKRRGVEELSSTLGRPAGEADGCAHPLLPRVGDVLDYAARSDPGEQGRFTLRLVQTNRESSVWEIAAAGHRTTFERACDRALGLADPWFGGPLPTISRAPDLWRFPAALETGTTFRGTAAFDGQRGLARAIAVVGRDTIDTPAGRFVAWRLAYEDEVSTPGNRARATGELWVAAHLGLIRSVDEGAGIRTTRELVAIHRREEPEP